MAAVMAAVRAVAAAMAVGVTHASFWQMVCRRCGGSGASGRHEMREGGGGKESGKGSDKGDGGSEGGGSISNRRCEHVGTPPSRRWCALVEPCARRENTLPSQYSSWRTFVRRLSRSYGGYRGWHCARTLPAVEVVVLRT